MSLSKVSKRPARWIDMVAGSERMLRVHHKNMVHFRNFQHNINDLDVTCRKNVNKLQQEIYDIYYGEFIPIKEQSDAIRFPLFKPLVQQNFKRNNDDLRRHTLVERGSIGSSDMSDDTRANSCISSVILPAITCPKQAKDKYSKLQMKKIETSSLKECSISDILALPPVERNRIGHLWRKELEKSLPVDSDSDVEETPRINSAKLRVIKKAVELTSQPALNQEMTRKSRALRESFLLNLRRQRETITNVCDGKSVNKLFLSNVTKENKLTKTQPDLLNNKIFNEIEDKFESGDILLKRESGTHLSKGLSSVAFKSSSTIASDLEETNKFSTPSSRNGHGYRRISNTFDDFDYDDENYYSETPDFFSEIDEEPSILDSSDLYDSTTSTFSTHSSDLYDSDESTSVN